MRHLRSAPPPIEAATLWRDGSLIGAAELAFDAMLGSGALALVLTGRV